jgi:hypothetical protein
LAHNPLLIMVQLHTVYDFSDESMHLTFLFPLVFAIIGLYVLAYVYKLTSYYIPFFFKKFKTRQQAIFTGFVFTIMGGFVALLVYNDNNKGFHHYKHIYKKHLYLVVQGRVTDFHRSTDKVHDPEYFNVDSIHFEYGDRSTEGYGYSLAQDDIIKSNLLVRIAYFNDDGKNVILKLEAE